METLDNMMDKNGHHAVNVPNPNFNPSDFIKEATGLSIDPETMKNFPNTQEVAAAPNNPNPTFDTPPKTQDQEEPIKEPEEEEETQWVKITGDNTPSRSATKAAEAQKEEQDTISKLFDESLAAEQARVDRAEQTIERAKQEAEAEGSSFDGTGTPKVRYDGNVSVETFDRPSKKDFNPVADDANSSIDLDDLVPAYTYDELMEEEKAEPVKPVQPATEESPDVTDEAAYSRYIQGLEVSTIEPGESAAKVVKNRQIETVQARSNKAGKFIGDQSFLNAITKFKKDNFTVVSVPMVNSGFILDIVGTGVVDLTQLYTRVNEQTSQMDYEIEKMRAVMKNVVATHPRIDHMQLKNYIHYRDYAMMAWGHICATLDSVEIVANCDDCGKPFRITSSPRALLMNMDEIIARQKEIESADDIKRHSLLTTNRKIITSNLFEVTIGHPTYAELISMMGQMRKYASDGTLNSIEANRFVNMTNILYQIRNIKLPNGIITSNVYQNYLALTMLSEEDYAAIENEIELIRKDILEPKFGVASVTCPHCKHVMKNIPYENLDELVFFHTMVSRMLNFKPIQNAENE